MNIQDVDMATVVTDDERGASMVEYALLLALIAMAAITAVSAFGGGLGGEFSDIGSSVDSALSGR